MYRVQVLIVKDEGVVVHRRQDALVFDVKDSVEVRGKWYGNWPGVIRPTLNWKTEYLGQEQCLKHYSKHNHRSEVA